MAKLINVDEVINYTPVAFEDITAQAKVLLKEFAD